MLYLNKIFKASKILLYNIFFIEILVSCGKMSEQSPFPPNFSISTPRLKIHQFDPTNPTRCAFLVQLWNTDDFTSSCGRTGVSTPEKASGFLQHLRTEGLFGRFTGSFFIHHIHVFFTMVLVCWGFIRGRFIAHGISL